MSSDPHNNDAGASPDTIEVSTDAVSPQKGLEDLTVEQTQVVSITKVAESDQTSAVTVTEIVKTTTIAGADALAKSTRAEEGKLDQDSTQVIQGIVAEDGQDVDDAPPPDPELLRRALESLSMQKQTEKVEVPVGEDDGKDGKYGNLEELAVEDGKNMHKIICPFCCKSTILLAKAAKYVKKSIFLPYPGSSSETLGENYEDHFEVTNQMQFENIAVKRSISTANQYQYLTCCDCDGGPVGIMYRSPGVQPVFYIAHKRIKYAPKK